MLQRIPDVPEGIDALSPRHVDQTRLRAVDRTDPRRGTPQRPPDPAPRSARARVRRLHRRRGVGEERHGVPLPVPSSTARRLRGRHRPPLAPRMDPPDGVPPALPAARVPQRRTRPGHRLVESLPEGPGVTHHLVPESGVLVVEFTAPLRAQDFDALAATADAWLATHAALPGVVTCPPVPRVGERHEHAAPLPLRPRPPPRGPPAGLAADGKLAD